MTVEGWCSQTSHADGLDAVMQSITGGVKYVNMSSLRHPRCEKASLSASQAAQRDILSFAGLLATS
eukprot:1158617-Pelagomonas_calceolata.AAC.11